MADLVDLVIEDERWATSGMDVLAEQAARAALEIANVTPDYEICVMACNDARITELNSEFREKPTATNVLSWPAFELSPEVEGGQPTPPPPSESLGDIAIAFETCEREAAEEGITMQAHVQHLIVHGCLHLLGYDHETDKDATLMEELEVKALASMGVDDPY
jgi:probable rRNA maturation factor